MDWAIQHPTMLVKQTNTSEWQEATGGDQEHLGSTASHQQINHPQTTPAQRSQKTST